MGYLFTPVLIFLVIVLFKSLRIIRQSTVGVVERLGQYLATRPAGLTLLIPFIDDLRIVDMREQVLPLPQQPVITRDNVTMNIDAIIYFQVTDPFRATYEVAQLLMAVEKLALTTVRNIIGDMSLDDTLTSRDVINTKLKHVLDEATGKWGLQVNRVELKDINPPRDIEEAMQKQMRAEREKRATILTAEGEKQSAILQAEGSREAAIRQAEGQKLSAILRAEGEAEALRTVKQAQADTELIVLQALNKAAPSPAVIQLKYLEALAQVANGQATKLVVPLESAAFMGTLASVSEGFNSNS